MMYYNLGIIIFFILYFIYDLNSIHWHLKIFNKLFMIGSIAFIVLNGLILYKFLPTITITFINVFLLIFAIAFLGLLIYTLFFVNFLHLPVRTWSEIAFLGPPPILNMSLFMLLIFLI